jgi:hypothetical protein
MSRTRRAYNDPRSCFYIDWTTSYLASSLPGKEAFAKKMLYATSCMGNCPLCKDRRRDARLRTEKAKLLKIEAIQTL